MTIAHMNGVDEAAYHAVARVLHEVVGLREPDLRLPLHQRLFDTVAELGPGATLGQRIVALRLVFNWALLDAGAEFADAKVEYERVVAREKTRLYVEEPKLSIGKAEAMVEADDAVVALKLTYLLAEQKERAMRKFLDTLDAALENHRTDRADSRRSDFHHAAAPGLQGGA